MAAGLFLGISALGGLVNTISNFFNAGAQKRIANENYELELENIEQGRRSGNDQIEKFNKQGEKFLGAQDVAVATSGVTGASGLTATSTSRGNIRKDARRMQEQLSLDIDTAKKRAKVNRDSGITQSKVSNMQGFGSLLTTAGNVYGTGHSWGMY